MSKWPKKLPKLTLEQQRIKDDFMRYWLEIVPTKYSIVERFSNGFPARNCRPARKILELGAGLGNQIPYEDLSHSEFHALELRPSIAHILKKRFPKIHVRIGDCQKKLPYRSNYFDRVQSIHVLEHLPNLPFTLNEVSRVLKPNGEFCVVIPCEGGLVHNFGREFAGKKEFERRYGVAYDWCIQSEHVNTGQEVMAELAAKFKPIKIQYFPFGVPLIHLNLFVGMVYKLI